MKFVFLLLGAINLGGQDSDDANEVLEFLNYYRHELSAKLRPVCKLRTS